MLYASAITITSRETVVEGSEAAPAALLNLLRPGKMIVKLTY